MTTHTPTYKRLNTGQPGVCVRGWAALRGKANLKPWYAKRYRRAVMQGAGVYLLGLWGVVMGRDRKIARFNFGPTQKALEKRAAYKREQALENLEARKAQKNKKVRLDKRVARNAAYGTANYSPSAAYEKMISLTDYALGVSHPSNQLSHEIRRYLLKSLSVHVKAGRTWRYLIALAALLKRADQYRAFLSRIVKTRKRPARIPRPIHTRPRPPAAPLAPPAIA